MRGFWDLSVYPNEMVDPHTNGCVQPEVLAAYVDRGLSLTERARVDAHLASCPQCIAMLAGVVRTVAELSAHTPDVVVAAEATPFVTRRSLAGALAAAAAVIAVVAAPSFVRPWFERDSGLVNLVSSVGEQRSVLGRLTGGFPHAPLGASSAGGQDGRTAGTDRVLLTAGKIRESFGERETPSQLHALGVSQLLEARYDDAAQSLLAASREQPANARYLSDVAAVQLERARLGLRPDDLPRALAAADRARRLDPSLNEAWFNRALAVSALSLNAEATAAWTEYLKRDGTSPWATEARTRLKELAKPTPAQAWTAMEGRLQRPFDANTADEAIRLQTTAARHFIEGLFGQWADAALRGNGATELARVRTLSDAMGRISGDMLYIDAVAAIDRAESRGDLQRAARAHQAFAAATALYDQDDFKDAIVALGRTSAEFEAIGSSFSSLSDVLLGSGYYYTGKYPDAERVLSGGQATAGAKHYLSALGRTTWLRGMIAFAQSRLADAQDYYEGTLSTFEQMGDVEQEASAHSLLAAYYFFLGDKANEWQHRQLSLQGLSVSNSPRFKYSILASASASVRFENPETALAMQDAVIASARQSGREAAIADALAQRAATLIALGRSAEAELAVAEARNNLKNLKNESFRKLFELPVLAAESDLLRARNPQAAAAAAQSAIKVARERGDQPRLAQFELRLAQANIVWGRLDEAKQALADGMRAFDLARAAMTDEGALSAADESWQLFDTAVQLAIHQGDTASAFALSERARARSLVERRIALQGPTLEEAQRRLRNGEVVVAVNQFDDELAVWAISAHAVKVVTRPLKRTDVVRLVGRQQLEIGQESALPEAGGILYDEIIRPLAAELKGAQRISFIPDATFQDMSFAALFDRGTKRFLVENVEVGGAPSMWAMPAARTTTAAAANDVLVMSASQQTDASARAIAGVYAQPATFLQGADATRSRFLADAPSRAVVHLSAQTRRNDAYPLLSGVVLADDPGQRHSGMLLGRDIAARPLANTKLVVLDESGSDRHIRGEGTLSMARAFMAAGVPAVLGTLPGADEGVTRDLMIGFHREMSKGVSAEEALSTVQRNALQQNGRRLGAWTALVLYGSDR